MSTTDLLTSHPHPPLHPPQLSHWMLYVPWCWSHTPCSFLLALLSTLTFHIQSTSTTSVLHELPPRTQPYLAISILYQGYLTQYRKKLENGLQVLPGQPTPSLASYHSAHCALCFSPMAFAVDLTAQQLLPQGLCLAFPSICTTLPPDKQLVNSFTFFKSLLKYYLLKL